MNYASITSNRMPLLALRSSKKRKRVFRGNEQIGGYMGRFAKIDTDIINHPLYKSDRMALCVYEHLLFTCTYKGRTEYGVELQEGERLTSYLELSKEIGVDRHIIKKKVLALIKYGLLEMDELTTCVSKKKKIKILPLNAKDITNPSEGPMVTKSPHLWSQNDHTYGNEVTTPMVTKSPHPTLYNNKIEGDRIYIYKRFHDFLNWQKENVPELSKMNKPLNMSEFEKLLKLTEGDAAPITNVLLSMANTPEIEKKHNSTYITAMEWIKRNMKDGSKK